MTIAFTRTHHIHCKNGFHVLLWENHNTYQDPKLEYRKKNLFGLQARWLRLSPMAHFRWAPVSKQTKVSKLSLFIFSIIPFGFNCISVYLLDIILALWWNGSLYVCCTSWSVDAVLHHIDFKNDSIGLVQSLSQSRLSASYHPQSQNSYRQVTPKQKCITSYEMNAAKCPPRLPESSMYEYEFERKQTCTQYRDRHTDTDCSTPVSAFGSIVTKDVILDWTKSPLLGINFVFPVFCY